MRSRACPLIICRMSFNFSRLQFSMTLTFSQRSPYEDPYKIPFFNLPYGGFFL